MSELIGFIFPVAFAVLYAIEFYNLKREGVYDAAIKFPAKEVLGICLFAIIGIPYALRNRARRAKEFIAGGGRLSGWRTFFNLGYTTIIFIWLALFLPFVISLLDREPGPGESAYWAGRESEAIEATQNYIVTTKLGIKYRIVDQVAMAINLLAYEPGMENYEVLGWFAEHKPNLAPSKYAVEFRIKYPDSNETCIISFLTDLNTGEVKPTNEAASSMWPEATR